jgi:hypothetical protein
VDKRILPGVDRWRENTDASLCTLVNTKGLKEAGGFKSRTNLFLEVPPEVYAAAKYGRLDIRARFN